MGSRVYIGNLPSRASERDLEHFFRGFGRIRDVMLKNGFGFVEFDDNRDAEDAVYEQNGRELMGHRVVVELSRRKPESRYGYGRRDGGGGSRDGGVMSSDGRVNGRFPPPMKTRYRMVITNLSSRCNWQEIKDMMRMDGKVNVTYADAHKRARNEALLCFGSHEDLKRAMDKFQGKDINGRRIKIVDDSEGGGSSGSRRRSRSRSDSRSRSHSRRRSRSRSRSRSARRSRSRSPPSRSRSRTASSKGSRAKNGGGNASGDEGGKEKQRSRSRSAASSAASSNKSGGGRRDNKSASRSPAEDGSPRNNDEEEGKKMEDE